jgi:hypothetical protein
MGKVANVGRVLSRGAFVALGIGVVALALALPMGCAKAPSADPAKVGGTVLFQGRALADGLIVFTPDPDRGNGGKLFTANINSNGRFQLADGTAAVAPGWYRVAIAEPAGWYGNFPAELRRPDRSGLEREVKPGMDHDFDFAIELTR